MTPGLDDAPRAVDFLWVLADATAKATTLLLVSWVVTVTCRRMSAAARHRLWALALCGLIALPVASCLVPGWRLPIRPTFSPNGDAGSSMELLVTTHAQAIPSRSAPPSAGGGAARLHGRARTSTNTSPDDRGASAPRTSRPTEIAGRSTPKRSGKVSWTASGILCIAWGVGVIAVALPTLLGLIANEWRRRGASQIAEEDWRLLFDELRRTLSIRREVELRGGVTWPIPLTWGVMRPVVLLPNEAQGWAEPTRRMVLLHELAHVQRFDVGVQLVGRFATALYWFHPLVWYAQHRLRSECEHACDDLVIRSGERPTEYAQQLLLLASSLRVPRFSTTAAMTRKNTLEQRIIALFDETRSRRPLGRRAGGLLAVATAALVLGLATVHSGPSANGADELNPSKAATRQESARISGRVVRDADAKTVEGAQVILFLPPLTGQDESVGKLPLRRTTTDAKGAFSFENLEAGRYRIWADIGKNTSRTRGKLGDVVVVPEAGEAVRPIELRVARAVGLTVRVKDRTTGKPIPHATVHLGWSEFPLDHTSDREGLAKVEPVTAEQWLVEVWADGFAKSSRWVNLENGTDAALEFELGPGGVLEGVVRDPSGKPIAGATLQASTDGNVEQGDHVKSDENGRFRFRNLPLDIGLRMDVWKSDYMPKTVPARLASADGQLNIVVEPRAHGGSLMGVVLDHKNQPIAGAEVVNVGDSSGDVRTTRTGIDGRFRLEDLFESSNYGEEVLVFAKGFAPKRVKVQTGPADKPAEVSVKLDPGHRVKGRVIDEKGRPLEAVAVYFGGGSNPFSGGGRAETDKDGRFAFDSLPADAAFDLDKAGYSEIADRHLPLDTDEVVTVTMLPVGVIVGRVLDAKTGKPVSAFKVRITFSRERQPDDPSNGLYARLSDPGLDYESDEGRFQLGDLVAGMPLQVMVSAQGYERRVAERVVVARSDKAKSEDFLLHPIDVAQLVTFHGRLLDAEGAPVRGAQLRCIAARDRDQTERWAFPFNWEMIRSGQLAQESQVMRFLPAVTNDRGQFEFAGIPKSAEVELVWWGRGIAPGRADHLERLDADGRQAIEIAIPAAARIAGTIDRKSFVTADRIQIIHTEGTFAYDDLDLKRDQGEFEVRDLAPGTYRVSLMTPYEREPGTDDGITSNELATVEVTVGPGETVRVEYRPGSAK